MEEISRLKMLELVLAKHRVFGNTDYIQQQLEITYQRRLTKISTRLSVAGELSAVLDRAAPKTRRRVIGDTVVRCAIQHALKQIETGTSYGFPLAQCNEIFQQTLTHLIEDKSGALLERSGKSVSRLGSESFHGWVWNEDHLDDLFGRSFRQIIQDNYGDPLCNPSAKELEVLQKGAELLNVLIPELTRNVLGHAHIIGIFPAAGNWAGKASSSQYRVSGTIFLNREALCNPWWVAEHLLHESLHQKLYDFRHGHSLLNVDIQPYSDDNRDDERKICSPWNIPRANDSNMWDTHRAVAAFHVYVHLSLLCTLAEQRAPELESHFGPIDLPLRITKSRLALDRAHYLGEAIKDFCWEELGLAGKWLIDWLIEVLKPLDSTPPPAKSHAHLYLDRYQTEARKVGYITDTTSSTDVPQPLDGLISEEIESVRGFLLASHDQFRLDQFDAAMTAYSRKNLGRNFVPLRRIIYTMLLDATSDAPTMRHSVAEQRRRVNDFIREMVERSSGRLDRILATY